MSGNIVVGASPKTLAQMNPKGILQFRHRVCLNCRRSIMGHWILPFLDGQKRAEQYCYRDGSQTSEGMKYD